MADHLDDVSDNDSVDESDYRGISEKTLEFIMGSTGPGSVGMYL